MKRISTITINTEVAKTVITAETDGDGDNYKSIDVNNQHSKLFTAVAVEVLKQVGTDSVEFK